MNRATSAKKSVLETLSRIRTSDLVDAMKRGEKWTMLTCHDPISAKIFDQAKIPCLLVSDLAAHTVYGYKSRASMTLDEMIPLARAVKSSCKRALVVADLPYGSYEESPQLALKSATRLVKEAGVDAVLLEGNYWNYYTIEEQVKFIASSGIPVVVHAHSRWPRTENTIGRYMSQDRDDVNSSDLRSISTETIDHLLKFGAFACLVDLVSSRSVRGVVNFHSERRIPIIGIGSGPHCDAQLMIWQDMAGFSAPKSDEGPSYPSGCSYRLVRNSALSVPTFYESEEPPSLVKEYTNLGEMLFAAAIAFKEDVQSGAYPSVLNYYG